MLRPLARKTGVILAVLLTSLAANAGHDQSATVSFWAWSKDGGHILLFVEDADRGSILAVKAVGKQASVVEVPVPEGIPPQAFLTVPPLSAWAFSDAGVKGLDSPDKKVQIVTKPTPGTLEVMFTNGERIVPAFGLPVLRDSSTGMPGQANLKEVVWTSYGHNALLIVTQTAGGAWGVALDQVVSFDTIPFRKKLKGPAAK